MLFEKEVEFYRLRADGSDDQDFTTFINDSNAGEAGRGWEHGLPMSETRNNCGRTCLLPPLNHYDLGPREVHFILWMSTSLAHKGGNKCTAAPSPTSCEDQMK